MVPETQMKLHVTEPNFLENLFLPPKLGKLTKNGLETDVLNLLKNLVVNFYWICLIMKIYINAQIQYLKEHVLSQSDSRIF